MALGSDVFPFFIWLTLLRLLEQILFPVFYGTVHTGSQLDQHTVAMVDLVPLMTLNDVDLIVIFTWSLLVTFCLSFVCDTLIGKFVLSKLPAPSDNNQEIIEQQ